MRGLAALLPVLLLLLPRAAGAQDSVIVNDPDGQGADSLERSGAPSSLVDELIAFDDARSRDRFATGIGAKLAASRRAAYQGRLEPVDIEGRPGLRYRLAPSG